MPSEISPKLNLNLKKVNPFVFWIVSKTLTPLIVSSLNLTLSILAYKSYISIVGSIEKSDSSLLSKSLFNFIILSISS